MEQSLLVRTGKIVVEGIGSLIGLTLIFIILWFLWIGVTHPSAKYYRLNVGMTTIEAVTVMGSAPKYATTPERYCSGDQGAKRSSTCDELASTSTEAILFWSPRMDTVVYVGVGPEDTVSYLGFGGY